MVGLGTRGKRKEVRKVRQAVYAAQQNTEVLQRAMRAAQEEVEVKKFIMIGTSFCIRLSDLAYVSRRGKKIYIVYDIEHRTSTYKSAEGEIIFTSTKEGDVFAFKTEDEAEEVMCCLAESLADLQEDRHDMAED